MLLALKMDEIHLERGLVLKMGMVLLFCFVILSILGSTVKPNDILVRQRGTKYWPGENVWLFIDVLLMLLQVIMGRDHTLHSSCDGIVEFTKCDENSKKIRSYVNVRKIVPLAHGEGSFNLQNIKDMLV